MNSEKEKKSNNTPIWIVIVLVVLAGWAFDYLDERFNPVTRLANKPGQNLKNMENRLLGPGKNRSIVGIFLSVIFDLLTLPLRFLADVYSIVFRDIFNWLIFGSS